MKTPSLAIRAAPILVSALLIGCSDQSGPTDSPPAIDENLTFDPQTHTYAVSRTGIDNRDNIQAALDAALVAGAGHTLTKSVTQRSVSAAGFLFSHSFQAQKESMELEITLPHGTHIIPSLGDDPNIEELMRLLDLTVIVYPDRLEINGLLPTQAVQLSPAISNTETPCRVRYDGVLPLPLLRA